MDIQRLWMDSLPFFDLILSVHTICYHQVFKIRDESMANKVKYRQVPRYSHIKVAPMSGKASSKYLDAPHSKVRYDMKLSSSGMLRRPPICLYVLPKNILSVLTHKGWMP